MKIVDGVYLHLIKTDKFKTNHLTCRFSADVTKVNKARRALVAQMLATANAVYPTSRLFRQKLADLYGANVTTNLSTRGLIHMIDIDLTFVANSFAPGHEDLVGEALSFLQAMLRYPLRRVEQYQPSLFELEKSNLIHYLESDKEDAFYAGDLALSDLYFEKKELKEPKYSTPEQVALEDAYTAFQEFRRMMAEDRIDFFLVGDIEEYTTLHYFHEFDFQPRYPSLIMSYQQPYSNVTREQLDQRETNQSVLSLAYHVPVQYGEVAYFSLLVINGLLGLFPHSLLFTHLREKEGLAYTVSSHLHPFQGLLTIQVGIERHRRQRVMQLITRQLNTIKSGRFSTELLAQTKSMILNNVALAEDNPKSLLEIVYNRSISRSTTLSPRELERGLANVSKKDVILVANQIKLQALHFMEGED